MDNKVGSEFILCAAIHYLDGQKHKDQPENIETGLVIAGRRHSDCYTTLMSLAGDDKKELVDREGQGFITSHNRFVGRKEAFQIAKKNNQIWHKLHDDVDENILISEDLY